MVFALIPLAESIAARVLSLPFEENIGGEYGVLMGGAHTAAAGGSDAMWFNPAGLAWERGRLITVSGVFPRYQETTLGAESRNQIDMGTGNFSFVQGISKGRGYPRFSYGISLAQTYEDELSSVIRDERLGSAGSLPFGLGNAANIDTDFPNGIQVSEFSEGLGRHSVVSTSVGLGMAFSRWLRLGVSLRVERLRLVQRNTTALELSGNAVTGTTNTLTGQSSTDWRIEGEWERMVFLFGLQLEIFPGLAMGATLRRPSKSLGGSGSVKLNHNSRLVINRDALQTQSSDSVWMEETNLPFQLISPQVLRIGFSFSSDSMVMAFEVASIREQAAYEVLPAVESSSPSTTAARLNAFTTSGAKALNIFLGVAMLYTNRTSLLAGLMWEESPVPFDDPVFRKVDLTTYSLGFHHARGRFSGSAGLSFQETEKRVVLLPALEGGDTLQRRVRLTRIGIHIGGSVAF